MANIFIKNSNNIIKELDVLSLYNRFPRSNKNYIKENTKIKTIVPFGHYLRSTVGYPTYTIIIQHMVKLPIDIKNILVGLLLSDG